MNSVNFHFESVREEGKSMPDLTREMTMRVQVSGLDPEFG
jgi:hypothetical protein